MDYSEISQLVERLKANDTAAGEQLYHVLSKSMHYYAFQLLHNREDAWDAVQETWLAFYKNIDKIEKPEAAAKYLKQILHRKCLSVLRKEAGALFVDDADIENLDIEEADDMHLPEQFTLNQERSAMLAELVGKLPVSQRSVVLLYYYDELSAREISEIVGIAEPAVYNRLKRARANLREWAQASYEKGILAMIIPLLKQALQENADEFIKNADLDVGWGEIKAKLDIKPLEPQPKDPNKANPFRRIGALRLTATGVAAAAVIAAAITGGNLAPPATGDMVIAPNEEVPMTDTAFETPDETEVILPPNEQTATPSPDEADTPSIEEPPDTTEQPETPPLEEPEAPVAPPEEQEDDSHIPVAGTYTCEVTGERIEAAFEDMRGSKYIASCSGEITVSLYGEDFSQINDEIKADVKRHLWPALHNEWGSGISLTTVTSIRSESEIGFTKVGQYELLIDIEFEMEGSTYQTQHAVKLVIK